MSFYKKKKEKEKEKDQIFVSACSCDNLTAKSNEESLNENMKIRINFNILKTGISQI